MKPWGGWRPLLRLARRDALRHRARSLLVVTLIGLPVAGVVAADVLISTAQVTGAESLERRLGAADARLEFIGGGQRVYQTFDPSDGNVSWGPAEGADAGKLQVGPAAFARTLGRPVRALPLNVWQLDVRTARGLVTTTLYRVDATDPMAAGLVHLTSGRLPTATGETAINGALAARGIGLGDQVTTRPVGHATVVGIVEGTSRTQALLVAPPDTFPMDDPSAQPMEQTATTWLIDAGPVSWSDVLKFNRVGATVLSRAVMNDPPPNSALEPQVQAGTRLLADTMLPVIVLIVVMALLEVVLLAGPAFAVTARRQARDLALVAASGGTPQQARRVVLGSGLVLGALAALMGAGLGVLGARLAEPLAQRAYDSWFGPFDVTWWQVGVVAAFGLGSALLAAAVPAWIASRQDVVAVLAGRRGDRSVSLRSPVLGVLILGGGAALAALGSRQRGTAGATTISGAAVVAVVGMILVVPAVVVAVARLGGRLPLGLRFAARDAARNRTRTVPAVAAVAATVAGVVALGIALASTSKVSEMTYQPQLAIGWGALAGRGPDASLEAMADAVRRESPDTELHEVRGMGGAGPHGMRIHVTGVQRGWLNEQFGSTYLVGDPALVSALPDLTDSARDGVRAALARGEVVVFAVSAGDSVSARLRQPKELGDATLTAPVRVVLTHGPAVAAAVIPPSAVTELGLQPQVTGLALDARGADAAGLARAEERVRGITAGPGLYVEHGYRLDPAVRIVFVILGAIGAMLMLGGTLTTTLLALSDARPDLATLSAVGAAPRARRLVAASYAWVVAGVGGLLGAVVGLIPGIAITRPLTSVSVLGRPGLPDHVTVIPWLLIVLLVVVLPLATALVMGLLTRSRLPIVARLS